MGIVDAKHKYSKLPIKHTKNNGKDGVYTINMDLEVPQYAQVSPAFRSSGPSPSRNAGQIWS